MSFARTLKPLSSRMAAHISFNDFVSGSNAPSCIYSVHLIQIITLDCQKFIIPLREPTPEHSDLIAAKLLLQIEKWTSPASFSTERYYNDENKNVWTKQKNWLRIEISNVHTYAPEGTLFGQNIFIVVSDQISSWFSIRNNNKIMIINRDDVHPRMQSDSIAFDVFTHNGRCGSARSRIEI